MRTIVTFETGRVAALKSRWVVAAVAALSFAFATVAHAHHSFAMFDVTKSVSYKGTVKELQ